MLATTHLNRKRLLSLTSQLVRERVRQTLKQRKISLPPSLSLSDTSSNAVSDDPEIGDCSDNEATQEALEVSITGHHVISLKYKIVIHFTFSKNRSRG